MLKYSNLEVSGALVITEGTNSVQNKNPGASVKEITEKCNPRSWVT